ncbi:DUF2809 domain-containing protein [bacterium]|nr:DUF2809 domain-containing protein [bacterium]
MSSAFFQRASFWNPFRIRLLLFLLVLIPTGFATKFYSGPLRTYVNDSLGGVLYVVFWIGIFAFLLQRAQGRTITLAVLAVTCGLEFLQLWHPPFLESIRSCFMGKTLIGHSFAWLDIPHYFIGAAAGYGVLRLLKRRI